MSTNINHIIYLFSRQDAKTLLNKAIVQQELVDAGFKVTSDSDKATTIISIGSDGDFLQAVRRTGFQQHCLYVGVSIEEKQGLYCDFFLHNFSALIDVLSADVPTVSPYRLIEVQVGDHPPVYCLNEFTIRSNIIRTLVVDIHIDKRPFQTFLGDGLIISTPTGSTAYNKSMNGAVVDPLLPSFQITELASVNNNTYRTLGTSVVLSANRTIHLYVQESGNSFPLIAADNEAIGIRKVDDVTIRLSEKSITTLRRPDSSFWEKVRKIYL